jgi:hypothetical protein
MSTPARNPYPVLAPQELREQVIEALRRYERGEQVRQICTSYGVSNVTLYKRIIEVAQDEWKALQVGRALSIKEKAEEDILNAPDGLSLARAREALKAAQWDLERVCRRIYGDAPPVQLTVNIGDVVGRVAELERELAIAAALPSNPPVLEHSDASQ